jgi:hypothetical protein
VDVRIRYGVDVSNRCDGDVSSLVVGEGRIHKIDVRRKCGVRISLCSR